MYYSKKRSRYEISNCHFDPISLRAVSYNWWLFVAKIGGKLVFNSFTYSNTTTKHQSKVKSLLRQLGIAIDTHIEAPQGLNNLDSSIKYYENQIQLLELQIAKPRSQQAKNLERQNQIEFYESKIKEVQELVRADAKLILKQSTKTQTKTLKQA